MWERVKVSLPQELGKGKIKSVPTSSAYLAQEDRQPCPRPSGHRQGTEKILEGMRGGIILIGTDE
jgi:hypothetical protein